MCEIAVVHNPIPADGDSGDESYDEMVRALVGTCRTLFDENPDGLGVVGIRRENGESFDYSLFKRVEPEFGSDSDLYEFFEENDDAWRFAIHARLKTHGGTGHAQTHPILVGGCPEIDGIQFVMHNGVIRADARSRRDLEAEGHVFNTHVDSEVIAHAFGSLPDHDGLTDDDFEEPDEITGRANFILFGEDRILLRMEKKYDTKTDFTIICTRRDEVSVEPDHDESGTHYGLITPDGGSSFRSAPKNYLAAYNGGQRGGRTAVWGHGSAYRNRYRANRTKGKQTTLNGDSDDEDEDSSGLRSRTRGTSHGDREPKTVTVVDPDNEEPEQSSYYCKDHGWHDELIEGDCPNCVRERASHGGVPNRSPWDGVGHCEEHDEFYNARLFSECVECTNERHRSVRGSHRGKNKSLQDSFNG